MRLLWLIVFAVEAWLLFHAVGATLSELTIGNVFGSIVLLLSALGASAYALRLKIANSLFWLICSFVIGAWCTVQGVTMLWNVPRLESLSGMRFPLSNMLAGGAIVALWFFLQWYVVFRYSRFLAARPA